MNDYHEINEDDYPDDWAHNESLLQRRLAEHGKMRAWLRTVWKPETKYQKRMKAALKDRERSYF